MLTIYFNMILVVFIVSVLLGQFVESARICIKEAGFCVMEDGAYQNSGVKKLNALDGNTVKRQENCLKFCLATPGVTGCEVIWDQGNRGCYAHTKSVSHGNGYARHMCWICNVDPSLTCKKETGFCVKQDGSDQNSGVIKLNSLDGNTSQRQEGCLKRCLATPGVTGCEVIWNQGDRGCYAHTNFVSRGNGYARHMCWICNVDPTLTCSKEVGFCVKQDGSDQNSGVIKLNSLDGNTAKRQEDCLKFCLATPGVTGCEVIWNQDNRGCYAHTKSVSRGNGYARHMCWICTERKPTDSPSNTPSISPTVSPTEIPTDKPTYAPTESPSNIPSTYPTVSPTRNPTAIPTYAPSQSPTNSPTTYPTSSPTTYPTWLPTSVPTSNPSQKPTTIPTHNPTRAPTVVPTQNPTLRPTIIPTENPTPKPTTSNPTAHPTGSPTLSPTTVPTPNPTQIPTVLPTYNPTRAPTVIPSLNPTAKPTTSPTENPTLKPTTISPTSAPTMLPSLLPTNVPTGSPTEVPTISPTTSPTQYPSQVPSNLPTESPSNVPTLQPTVLPTKIPTDGPTELPSNLPSKSPTVSPTRSPTAIPTYDPTESPTSSPSTYPTTLPTNLPSKVPTNNPTFSPTEDPTFRPSHRPSPRPTNQPTPVGVGGVNDHSFCRPNRKCSLGQGDCDTNNDCASGLTCGSRNCRSFHPTASPTADCCYVKPGIGANDDWSYCSPSRKCSLGQGDCDTNDDCAAGLTCGVDNCRTFHPNADSAADCCYDKPGIGATDDNNFCSPSRKCSVGQGDCDSNNDCAAGLTCGHDNCQSFHVNAQSNHDCCYDKPGIGAGDDSNYCSPSRKCAAGQGDCDSDNDCAAGLVCGTDNCRQFHSNAQWNHDCCYDKPGIGADDDWSYCTSSRRCSEGQGDCDSDSDCAAGLICGKDNCQKFNSKAVSLTDCCMRKLKLTQIRRTHWMNSWDGLLSWSAGSNEMITGFYSKHDNVREDRLWAFYSAAASGVSCTAQGWHGWANNWDSPLSFVCPNNQAMHSVISVHDNHKEDRRWKFRCCVVSSNAYLKRGGWTDLLNHWDGRLDFRCKPTEVLAGLKSYHHNHYEDRRWKFHCAELLNKL